MEELSPQSNSFLKTACFVGTASILSLSILPNSEAQIPLNNYNCNYEQVLEAYDCYKLKHEIMPQMLKQLEAEPVIEIPITRAIEVTYNKPNRLEFTSVEDEEGFIS